jgi:hypothetical protein
VAVGLFYPIAACCARLAIFAKTGREGVSVITCYDKQVVSTMNDFFNMLTDDEIAARYVPDVP